MRQLFTWRFVAAVAALAGLALLINVVVDDDQLTAIVESEVPNRKIDFISSVFLMEVSDDFGFGDDGLTEGFIDFARVVHAKYMVVDGHFSWVGTSNWSRDYFASSRNVGIVVEGASLATKLDGWFEHNWTSEYAELVRPGRRYHAPPRTARDLERERNRPKPGVDNGDDDDE